jgi:hypothetical protein
MMSGTARFRAVLMNGRTGRFSPAFVPFVPGDKGSGVQRRRPYEATWAFADVPNFSDLNFDVRAGASGGCNCFAHGHCELTRSVYLEAGHRQPTQAA